MDRARLAVAIRRHDGTRIPWGDNPERGDTGRLPKDLSFSTSALGGHKEASCELSRDPLAYQGDLDRLDEFLVYGPGFGNLAAWEGYNVEFPKHKSGSDEGISVGAVGWSGYLGDDPNLVQVFIDRGPENWGEPPQERLAVVKAAGNPYGTDHAVTIKTKAIHFEGPTQKNVEGGSTVEAWYTMPAGVKLHKLWYRGENFNTGAVFDGPELLTTANIDGSGPVTETLTADTSLRSKTAATPARYNYLRFRAAAGGYNKAAGAAPARTYRDLAVIGDHNLPLTQETATVLPGILASDVIPYVLEACAPLLRWTTGLDGSIQPTDFLIPHLVFMTPATAEEALAAINAFHQYDLGVYDDREFFFRPQGSGGRLWIARTDEGATLNDNGPDSQNIWTGAIVAFTDPDGQKRIVGPPGYAYADATDPALEVTTDDDPTNPALSHGRARRKFLEVTTTTTQSGAIEAGARWLYEQSRIEESGDITLTGWVKGEDGGLYPPWVVRGGDRVVIENLDRNRERPIMETSYTHKDTKTVATLDSPSHRWEVLMERLAIVTPEFG